MIHDAERLIDDRHIVVGRRRPRGGKLKDDARLKGRDGPQQRRSIFCEIANYRGAGCRFGPPYDADDVDAFGLEDSSEVGSDKAAAAKKQRPLNLRFHGWTELRVKSNWSSVVALS